MFSRPLTFTVRADQQQTTWTRPASRVVGLSFYAQCSRLANFWAHPLQEYGVHSWVDCRPILSPFRRVRFSLGRCPSTNLTNSKQVSANFAFVVDTGKFPLRFMRSLIRALYSVLKSHAGAHIGSLPEVQSVSTYRCIHQVVRKSVSETGRNRTKKGSGGWTQIQCTRLQCSYTTVYVIVYHWFILPVF